MADDRETMVDQQAGAVGAAADVNAPRPKLWTGTFFCLVCMTFITSLSGNGLNSGASVFLDAMGYGAALAGILGMVFSFTAGVARMIVGPAVDRGNTRRIMVAGSLVLVVGTFLPVVDSSVAMMIFTRVLQGLGFGICTTSASAVAAVVLPQERLGEGIGYHGLGQALSGAVGPAFALWLVGTDPATNLYFGIGLVTLVNVVFALLINYEKHPEKLPESCAYRLMLTARGVNAAASEPAADEPAPAASAPAASAAEPEPALEPAPAKESFLRSILEPKALVGAIPQLLASPGMGFGIYFLGVYGIHIGIENVGLFFTIASIVMLIVRANSGRFMDTAAPIKIFTVGIAAGLISYVLLLVCGTIDEPYLLLMVAGVPYGIMGGLCVPINQSVSIKNSPQERYGAATAMFLLMCDIGIGSACGILGIISDAFGFATTLMVVMGCLVAAYVLAWICYPASAKQWRKR